MSSYYTSAQLEAQRQARIEAELERKIQEIKNQLANSIQNVQAQLQIQHVNKGVMTEMNHYKVSVQMADDAVEGRCANVTINAETLLAGQRQQAQVREGLDWSKLLQTVDVLPTKLEIELESWIKKVDERPMLSPKDEADRERILIELNTLLQSSDMDIEDKIQRAKKSVTSYLQAAPKLSEWDKAQMESNYCEYCALCELLEEAPVETVSYRIEKEIQKMKERLTKQAKDAYVQQVISEIMTSIGCELKTEVVLNQTEGQLYSVDGHPFCDVFVGNEGSGILFETVGKDEARSMEQKRNMERSANSICSLYQTVAERAAQRGVILKQIYFSNAVLNQMHMQSDVNEQKVSKKQRNQRSRKQNAARMEE